MSKPTNFQQREIKFRVWDAHNGKMIDPDRWSNDLVMDMDGELKWYKEHGYQGGMLDISNTASLVLMQYTGLKDKNGREIYEGDVVRKMMDGEPDRVFEQLVMKWESEQWTEEGFMTGFSQLWTSADQYEIIGNIYENPELTKL